jgi:Protein of unknown function (DUF3037)
VSGGSPFSYAVYRLVPRVERGEQMNVGVLVFCRPLRYLAARTGLDERRLAAFWPDLDPEEVRPYLDAIERIAAGDPGAGPIAQLDETARFHWLVSPSSTIIQPSDVHTGLCGEPDEELDKLFRSLVASPGA